MTVRKKVVQPAEAEDVFEDVIEQQPQVIQFRIADIDRQIARQQSIKDNAQTEIDKLNARKAAAEALPK